MKNCSFKWLLSTVLLITTALITSVIIPVSATPAATTSQEVKISPTDLPVALNTDSYQPAVYEKENGTIKNDRVNFAETPAPQKIPMLYAKTIAGAEKNFKTTATGNYRGNAYHRMM